MTYRKIWTDGDFTEMGWHDSVVYSMSFPQADYVLRFDIDYLFAWHWAADKVKGWDVAPCTLEFHGVSALRMSLDWRLPGEITQGDTTVSEIRRYNRRMSPDGKFVCWDYEIDLDVGVVNFIATGFEQVVRSPPLFSESQFLGREARLPK